MRSEELEELPAGGPSYVPSGGDRKLFGCVPVTCLPAPAQRFVLKDQLLLATVLAVVGGLAVGLLLAPAGMSQDVNRLVSLPGRIFLRSLKLLVLPLVCGSIAGGVLSLRRMGSRESGTVKRITRLAMSLYALTYVLAIATGVVLVNVIHPGSDVASSVQANHTTTATKWQCKHVVFEDVSSTANSTGGASSDPLIDSIISVVDSAVPSNLWEAAHESNILGLICFSIAVALCADVNTGVQPPSAAEATVKAVNDVVAKLVNALLALSPVGIFSLVVGKITEACDVADMFASLSGFIATVVAALAIHAFVWLPMIYVAVCRRSPLHYFRSFAKSLLTAVAISSSAATLPVTLQCCEAYGVPRDLANFVVVLGATVNMDGTAMYEAVAALFIAQRHGVTLSVPKMLLVAVTGSLAAVGAAAIPSAGLVTLVMVLQAADLERYVEDIALILVVDWFLDRLRTAVNVMGDGIVCCVVHHLQPLDTVDPSAASVDAAAVNDGECPASAVLLDSTESEAHSRALPGTGVFCHAPGDIVSARTVHGYVAGACITHRSIDRQASVTYDLRLPDGQVLNKWDPAWLRVDCTIGSRVRRLEGLADAAARLEAGRTRSAGSNPLKPAT
ncbi:Excitatory amino acid transporter [Diplonema papillatum]|nr:Excitatory amino acid transporter [Diplonema papillatum]|eukprot:gene7836-12043_t